MRSASSCDKTRSGVPPTVLERAPAKCARRMAGRPPKVFQCNGGRRGDEADVWAGAAHQLKAKRR